MLCFQLRAVTVAALRTATFCFGFVCILIFPGAPRISAQAGVSRSIGGIETMGTNVLAVQVRSQGGLILDTLAIVTLLNSNGNMIASKLTVGSEAVFTPINSGSYIVDVEASGFSNVSVPTHVSVGTDYLIVTLQGVSSTGSSGSSQRALSPKAQREAGKAFDAFQAGKYGEAIKRLEVAKTLAPKYADVPYLLGVVYEKKQDLTKATEYWRQALEDDPKHLNSLVAMGDVLLRQDNLPEARRNLELAVAIEPNSWRAHSLLAAVLLRQGLYVEAVTNSERAIDLGKGQADPSRLILGQALAAEHQYEEAITTLQGYLATKPPDSMAQSVKNLIARLRKGDNATAPAPIAGVVSVTATSDIPDISLTPEARHWLPANIDDGVPIVEPGISCSLEDVLKKVSAHAQELPALVDRFSATEILHHEDVNNAGFVSRAEDLSFNYIASIQEIKSDYGNFLNVEEYRNGSPGDAMFPDQTATKGLPSIVLIFHPWVVNDFDMKCEGLGRLGSRLAWQIYFRQRDDKENVIRRYRINGRKYPIALKGRAWIDATTFQVLKLETDLREAHPDIHLAAEHLVVEYGPVQFKNRKEVLWLPSLAEYYSVFRGHRFHRRHTFTNYVLFSVDDKQKIGEPPKAKTAEASVVPAPPS